MSPKEPEETSRAPDLPAREGSAEPLGVAAKSLAEPSAPLGEASLDPRDAPLPVADVAHTAAVSNSIPPSIRLEERRAAQRSKIRRFAGIAAAAGVLLFGYVRVTEDGTTTASAVPDGGAAGRAAQLREGAWDDYRNGRYGDAVRKLDEAKGLSPEDEGAPEIVRLRKLLGAPAPGAAP
jgi:hypothetical protein